MHFGKAMANGFSVAAVAGKREIMQLGSIEFEGEERVFLLSTTHGAEMGPLGAFIKTYEILKREKVVDYLWGYGTKLKNAINTIAKNMGIEKNFVVDGIDCQPFFLTFDNHGRNSMEFRTLFLQEMIKNRVLFPCICMSYSHQEEEFKHTLEAITRSLEIYKRALNTGISQYLQSKVVKPVFRKYN